MMLFFRFAIAQLSGIETETADSLLNVIRINCMALQEDNSIAVAKMKRQSACVDLSDSAHPK